MRKPYTKPIAELEIKSQELLKIEEHGIEYYRKVYKHIGNSWHLVGLGCMNCCKSYQSLTYAVNHITKCKTREINTLTEDIDYAST